MMEQGSAEWFAARCGKVTASRVADVIAKTRSGEPGESRATYMAQLIAERLTGSVADNFKSAAMQWGVDNEPLARKAYSFRTDSDVTLADFIDHPQIPMSGASPDGLIGDVGLVEFKCPTTKTHLDTLMGAKIPDGYIVQMQWQMVCTNRQWCDYVSFDPRLPETMRLHITRVPRDEKRCGELEQAVERFLAELETKVRALQSQYEAAA